MYPTHFVVFVIALVVYALQIVIQARNTKTLTITIHDVVALLLIAIYLQR